MNSGEDNIKLLKSQRSKIQSEKNFTKDQNSGFYD